MSVDVVEVGNGVVRRPLLGLASRTSEVMRPRSASFHSIQVVIAIVRFGS